jgi:hypothetical protein
MDLLAKSSGGANIVARPYAEPRFYPAGTAPVAYCQVWWRFASQPPSQAQLFGVFVPGQTVSFPYNPDVDQNITFSIINFTADGVPDVSNLEDAYSFTVLYQRETAAPTVSQVGAATQTTLQLAIDGYTPFARKRRVRVADNALMTGATELITDNTETGVQLPRVININRSDTETSAQTIYVRVSHSSGGTYGAESEVQSFTFAASGGTGGSTGTGSPYAFNHYDILDI